MVGLEIDDFISIRGNGKSASYLVIKNFIDSSSNEKKKNSNNGISLQQIEPFSSPKTIEKVNKDIENENIQLENSQRNTLLSHHHEAAQPRNHQRKIGNSHLNKSTYCLNKFLQEEISFLRKELGNKQKVIYNLINLLNDVTTKHDETNFSCKSLQIKTTSEKASNIKGATKSYFTHYFV